jgi:hypothetical protein
MRVVIPYRYSSNNDLELAVKSIIRNYKPLQEIIIVGDQPKFKFDGQVILCKDTDKKERNIFNKLKRVPGEVLFTNDDIFFLKEISDVPNYYKGLCSEYSAPGPQYQRMYKNCPAGWLDFDVHCPMVINTDIFRWLGDMPMKSQYGNSVGLVGTFTQDFKARAISEINWDREFLSITEGISKKIEPLLRDFLS